MPARREPVAPARRIRLSAAFALAGLLGCVHPQTAPAPPAAAPLSPGRAPGAPPAPMTATPAAQAPAVSPSPAPGAATQPPAALNPPVRPAAAAPPGPRRPAPAPASPATASGGAAGARAPAPAGPAAPAAAAGSAAPALDLTGLEERLRETHAIGVFTKLSLKNQVDDLLAQFRAFYGGHGGLTLAELRRSYELLLMKVVTLLQNADPGLASAVSSSREAIWAILSDRNRFNNL